jgi:hypothetical protein
VAGGSGSRARRSIVDPLFQRMIPTALFLLAAGAWSVESRPAAADSSRALLAEAFHRRYECDFLAVVELTVRDRSRQVLGRTLHVASKYIDARLYSTASFEAPPHVRGTRLLTIEPRERRSGDDHFLYLPSLRRVRRISSAQRADSFLGTDLAYEDFERRRIEDYEIEPRPGGLWQGESVHVIVGRPTYESAYDRVEFSIATSDLAILRIRYFKRGADEPYKELRAPRDAIRAEDEFRVPTRLEVENRERGTATEVALSRLQINPEIEDTLFSQAALEMGRPIPGLPLAPGTNEPRGALER